MILYWSAAVRGSSNAIAAVLLEILPAVLQSHMQSCYARDLVVGNLAVALPVAAGPHLPFPSVSGATVYSS